MQTTQVEIGHAAARAAATAAPFAELLLRKCAQTAESFRRGDDTHALGSVESLVEELEYFIKFLVLIADEVDDASSEIGRTLTAYREQLVSVIESIEPALADSDFVEVADALEDDLAPQIAIYRSLDASIQGVLAAPV